MVVHIHWVVVCTHKKFAFEIERVVFILWWVAIIVCFLWRCSFYSKTKLEATKLACFSKKKSYMPQISIFFIASKYVAKQSLRKASFVHYFDLTLTNGWLLNRACISRFPNDENKYRPPKAHQNWVRKLVKWVFERNLIGNLDKTQTLKLSY